MAEVSAEIFEIIDKPISCHAWSADGERVALCPNDETIQIYARQDGLDWFTDAKGHRLISVSADRNGYVWTKFVSTEWKQTLVLLRLRRAATCVRWSADGAKFAVGSSEGVVSVGSYEEENDWWVCKHLKRFDGSAILSLGWHPCGKLLAVSSLSGRVELVTTTLKNVDRDTTGPSWIPDLSLLTTFDQTAGSLDLGCWIHSISFSPSGDILGMAGHDGNVHIMDFGAGTQLKCNSSADHNGLAVCNGPAYHNGLAVCNGPANLPLRRVIFISENAIIASGFGNSSPIIVVKDRSGQWIVESDLQSMTKRQSPNESTTSSRGMFGSALAKFKALDSQGISMNSSEKSILIPGKEVFHVSGLSDIRMVRGSLSSSGHDGKLILWNLSSLLNRFGIKAL